MRIFWSSSPSFGAMASWHLSAVHSATPPSYPTQRRPSASAAHEWLGRLYEKSGRVAAARSEYRASTALNPDRKSPKERLRRLE